MPCITEKQAALDRVTPLAQRATVRYHQAAVLTGLPYTKIELLVTSGAVKSCKIGKTRLIDVKSLLAVIERAQSEALQLDTLLAKRAKLKAKAARGQR